MFALTDGMHYYLDVYKRQVYNKSHHTGNQSDTCVNLQSKGWYFLLLYLP